MKTWMEKARARGCVGAGARFLCRALTLLISHPFLQSPLLNRAPGCSFPSHFLTRRFHAVTLAVFSAAGLNGVTANNAYVGTFFLPTNAAWSAFLAKTGLTMAQLTSNFVLVEKLAKGSIGALNAPHSDSEPRFLRPTASAVCVRAHPGHVPGHEGTMVGCGRVRSGSRALVVQLATLNQAALTIRRSLSADPL